MNVELASPDQGTGAVSLSRTEIIDRLTSALSDRYRLDRELGAGGMATVYLAHDLKHDRGAAFAITSRSP